MGSSRVDRIIDAIYRRPKSFALFWIALSLFGARALIDLRVEHLPRITIPSAAVVAEYSDLSAEEIERNIAVPLENALASIAGIRSIETVSKAGICAVNLIFAWGSDLQLIAGDIGAAIDEIYPSLPDGARKPALFIENRFESPIARLAIIPKESGAGALLEASEFAENNISEELRRVEGVGVIRFHGLREAEIGIFIDPERIANVGLSLPEISSAIALGISDRSVGAVSDGKSIRELRVSAAIERPKDVEQIPIGFSRQNAQLTVSDIASARWTTADPTSIFVAEGRESIGITIYAAEGANIIQTGRALKSEIAAIADRYERNLKIATISIDIDEIEDSFSNLILSIILGVIATVGAITLFFRSIRLSAIVAVTIPASLIGVAIILQWMNISINNASASGIAIAIGMMVDNSVIMVEHLRMRMSGVSGGSIVGTLIASTVTTIIVFAPILFIPGVTGALFIELAITIIASLVFSLLASITLIPALFCLYERSKKSIMPIEKSVDERLLESRYISILRLSFDRSFVVSAGIFAVVAIGVAIFLILPVSIVPIAQKSTVILEASLNRRLDTDSIASITKIAVDRLEERSDTKNVIARSGYYQGSLRERSLSNRSIHDVVVEIELTDAAAGSRYGAEILGATAIDYFLSHSYDVEVRLPRASIEEILGIGEKLDYRVSDSFRNGLLENIDSLTSTISERFERAELSHRDIAVAERHRFELDPIRSAHLGIASRSLSVHLRAALRGNVVGTARRNGDIIPIRARFDKDAIPTIESLSSQWLVIDGNRVLLDDIGEIHRISAPLELHRYNRSPSAVVSIAAADEKQSDSIERFLRRSKPAEGEIVSRKAWRENTRSLWISFIFAVFLIYLVLSTQLNSLTQSLFGIVLLLPAAAGSAIALAISGGGININSILGIMIMIGTSVNSAILLVNGYQSSDGTIESVIRSSAFRVRSIVATISTTAIAIMPIVFLGIANNPQAETAISMIGGLTFGAAATMIALPIWYRKTLFISGKSPRHVA